MRLQDYSHSSPVGYTKVTIRTIHRAVLCNIAQEEGMFFTFSGDGNHGHRQTARLEIQTTIQDKIQQLYLWHEQMLVCPLSTSTERKLRQKKGLWELFQSECVQISASLICHSKETQNEFKYHSLKDLIYEQRSPQMIQEQ